MAFDSPTLSTPASRVSTLKDCVKSNSSSNIAGKEVRQNYTVKDCIRWDNEAKPGKPHPVMSSLRKPLEKTTKRLEDEGNQWWNSSYDGKCKLASVTNNHGGLPKIQPLTRDSTQDIRPVKKERTLVKPVKDVPTAGQPTPYYYTVAQCVNGEVPDEKEWSKMNSLKILAMNHVPRESSDSEDKRSEVSAKQSSPKKEESVGSTN